jgi:hypothetical protein
MGRFDAVRDGFRRPAEGFINAPRAFESNTPEAKILDKTNST